MNISFSIEKKVKSRIDISRDLLTNDDTRIHSDFFTPEIKPTKKSAPLAVLLSLAIPGAGETYADNFSSGKYYLISEAGLWITYFGFNMYGSWIQTDAREFAKTYAGVSLQGKNDKFFVNVGNYMSVDEFNSIKLLNRQSDKLYNPPSQYYWKWRTNQERLRFRRMRIQSDETYNNLKFVGIGVLLNHIASAVNAAISTSSYNKSIGSSLTFQLKPTKVPYLSFPQGIQLSCYKSF